MNNLDNHARPKALRLSKIAPHNFINRYAKYGLSILKKKKSKLHAVFPLIWKLTWPPFEVFVISREIMKY